MLQPPKSSITRAELNVHGWLDACLHFSVSLVLNLLLTQLEQTLIMVILYLLSSSHLMLPLENSVYLANSFVVCKLCKCTE